MSKLLLGAVAGIGAIGGGAYYVSQIAVPDIDTPPYLASGSVGSVYAVLSKAPLPNDLAKLDSDTNPEIAELADVHIVAEPEPGWVLRWTLVVDGVRYMNVSATLSAIGGKTAVDVRAAFPDSPFTQSGHLHPFDLKLLAAMFDLSVTDYIASIIEKRPPRSLSSLNKVIEAKLGFDDQQKSEMSTRIYAALSAVESPIMARAAERSGGSPEDIARAMGEATSATDARPDERSNHGRGRDYDPRSTMRQGVQPSTSAQPMVDVGNGR
jgi:hypothetical protein